MRHITIASLLVGFLSAYLDHSTAQTTSGLATNGVPYTETVANPSKGFNYPYLLYSPPDMGARCFPYLIVEPNNAGGLSADDSALVEARAAAVKVATAHTLGNDAAQRLGAVLLVPVFPRPPYGDDSNIDSYSLARRALLTTGGHLKRVDLQLLAMISDARERLQTTGCVVNKKVLMTGFSSSGLFANRFTLLHPEAVEAAAYGGVNGFIMLPITELKGKPLEYPLGLADYRNITGHEFDQRAWASIPQLATMGANDTNDAAPYDDEYTSAERDLIFNLVGKQMMPSRWSAVESVYRGQPNSVRFKTYLSIGHYFDEREQADVVALFETATDTRPMRRLSNSP